MTYTLTSGEITILILLAIWELIWKGIALWRAALRHQAGWFVALLIISSAGILPIIYILLTEQRPQPSGKESRNAA